MIWDVEWFDQHRAYYWKAVPLRDQFEPVKPNKKQVLAAIKSTLGLFILLLTTLLLISIFLGNISRLLSILFNAFGIFTIWALYGWTRLRIYREWTQKAKQENWIRLSTNERIVKAAKFLRHHHFGSSVFVSYVMTFALMTAMLGFEQQRNILAIFCLMILILTALKRLSRKMKIRFRLLLKLVDHTGRKYSLIIGLLSQLPLAFLPVLFSGFFTPNPTILISIVLFLFSLPISVIPLLYISHHEKKKLHPSKKPAQTQRFDKLSERTAALDCFAKGEVGDIDRELVLEFLS